MRGTATEPSDPRPFLAAVALVLATICWGGGTSALAQAAALGGMGLIFVIWPADRLPSPAFRWLSLFWLGLACVPFLPAHWFSNPEWREQASALGISLPTTLTPQPWVTVDGILWLVAGLAWLGWLTALPIDHQTRRRVVCLLAGGMIAISAVALVCWKLHWSVPGWLSERGFGPFPNRNHTGHVLAVGGLLAVACAIEAGRRRWIESALSVFGAGIILVALVACYSRGAVLLFFGGLALWIALAAWQRRSWPIAAIGGAGILVAISAVLLAGGGLAGRFTGGADSQVAFRLSIWRDTLALIHSEPWSGIGLGNFRAVFPFHREASVIQQAVWHPESDWLLLAAESSWLGLLVAVALFVVVASRTFPLVRGTQRDLRGAALATAVAAALHGMIDVPLHRLGCALLWLLVLVLARVPRESDRLDRSAAIGWTWRLLGIAMIGFAARTAPLSDYLAEADAFAQDGKLDQARGAIDQELQREPLNWEAYFARGTIAVRQGQTLGALAEFRRARFLEPHHAIVPLQEGKIWAPIRPTLALAAWSKALRRVPDPGAGDLYGEILRATPDVPEFRTEVLKLVENRPPLQLQWLCTASASEAAAVLPRLRQSADTWDPDLRRVFEKRAAELTGVR